MGMKKTSFFVYNIIGSIVRAITLIILGVVFASYYEVIIDYLMLIFFIVLVGVFAYMYKFKKESLMEYIHEKNKEIDEKIK